MSSHVIHPSDEVLEEYHFQRLSNSEVGQIDEHLLWCADCQDRLAAAEQFIDRLRPALQEPPSRTSLWALFRTIPSPVLAGVCAVVLAIGLYVPRLAGPSRSLEETTLVTARGAESPAEARIHTARRTVLHLDVTGVSLPVIFRVDIVGRDGSTLFNTTATNPVVTLNAPIAPGTYFVRLNTAAGDPLREYVLRVVP